MKEELQAYKDQLRENLGKYTRKAFRTLPKMTSPCILDIGCGSGVPTMELAKLSDGEIIAIDTSQPALDRLASNIRKAGLSSRVKAMKCSMLNMNFPDESFDIIWAEGSIIMDFEKCLKEWRRLIKPRGFLVVHDGLGNLKEKRRQIFQCGYEPINHLVLSEHIWWNKYYAPLEKKLNKVRAKHTSDQTTIVLLHDDQLEIDTFKRHPKLYRSVFFVMRKVPKSMNNRMPMLEARAKSKSNLDFRLMSLTYKFRDFLLPRMNILKEVGIEAGFHVLDFGCGPGSYIMPIAELVGKSGKIYALDIYPLAIRAVQSIASRKRLANVQTILSDCKTGLPANSMDVVLLYDILHHLDDRDGVLTELHIVLRPKGILSVTDHHMKQDEIVSRVTSRGLFKLSAKSKRTYSFSREE